MRADIQQILQQLQDGSISLDHATKELLILKAPGNVRPVLWKGKGFTSLTEMANENYNTRQGLYYYLSNKIPYLGGVITYVD